MPCQHTPETGFFIHYNPVQENTHARVHKLGGRMSCEPATWLDAVSPAPLAYFIPGDSKTSVMHRQYLPKTTAIHSLLEIDLPMLRSAIKDRNPHRLKGSIRVSRSAID